MGIFEKTPRLENQLGKKTARGMETAVTEG